MRAVVPLLASLLVAAPAAATITIPSRPITFTVPAAGGPVQQFGIGLNGFVNGFREDALGADLFLTLNEVSSSGRLWEFTARIVNTSGAPLTSARISAFGFATATGPADPAFVPISSIALNTSTIFDRSAFTNNAGGLNIPELNPGPQLCFKAGGNTSNCAGAGGGGLGLGSDAHSMRFRLLFNPSLSSLTLNNFVVRYQSISGTGAAGAVYDDASGVGYADVVPEPASWAMLIAGFGLVGAAMRRRRPAPV